MFCRFWLYCQMKYFSLDRAFLFTRFHHYDHHCHSLHVCLSAAPQWPQAGSMLMEWICTTRRRAEGRTLCCWFLVLWVNITQQHNTAHLSGGDGLTSCMRTSFKLMNLISSPTGSTRTDFGPQLKSLNKERFTVVGWDPRGYGQSRPPDRDFPVDFFERDAKDAVDLMKV